jgi:hypothetical protein
MSFCQQKPVVAKFRCPIEPDVISEFDWQDRRRGNDRQLAAALKTVSTGISM